MKLLVIFPVFLSVLLPSVTAQFYPLSPRPILQPSPYYPRVPFPSPPIRSDTKVCVVNTHADGVTDDSFSILFALHDCNDGGHVLFLRDETYIIGTALDLTFLKHVDIGTVPAADMVRDCCLAQSCFPG